MPDDVSNLTPEQATAKLAELEAAYRPAAIAEPKTPQEAALKLQTLAQNQQWRDQLLAGDSATRQQFATLTEMAASAADRLDNVLSGAAQPQPFEITTPSSPLSTRDLTSAVDGLRELGIDDDPTRDFAKGEKVSPELYRKVEQWKARQMTDTDFVKRYMANDPEAIQQRTIANIIVAAGVAEE